MSPSHKFVKKACTHIYIFVIDYYSRVDTCNAKLFNFTFNIVLFPLLLYHKMLDQSTATNI